jgi:hypothetical protein
MELADDMYDVHDLKNHPWFGPTHQRGRMVCVSRMQSILRDQCDGETTCPRINHTLHDYRVTRSPDLVTAVTIMTSCSLRLAECAG